MASGPPTIDKIERAHQMYRDGNYAEALGYYTEALGVALAKPQKIALHSNRAACYLRLHEFNKASEECTSVLEFDQEHTGALMLRAQTLVTLKEYQLALFDVNRLIELNPSSEVYRNLQTRLKTQLMSVLVVQGKSLSTIPEDDAEFDEEEDEDCISEINLLGDQVEGPYTKADTADESPDRVAPSNCTESSNNEVAASQKTSEQNHSGWRTIPKPKGHSHLDYSRWDKVEDDSSDEEEEEECDSDSQPQYRFRVKTVGVRTVK